MRDDIDELRGRYTDQYVMVDATQPELARFANLVGQVRTVNMSGQALVQFDGPDRAWYDIAPAYLRIVDKPAPPPEKPAKVAKEPAKPKADPPAEA